MRTAATWLGALALLAAVAAPGSAHSPPVATGIAIDGGAAVVATTRGLMLRSAEGEPFRHLCHEGYGGVGRENPGMAFTSGGELLLATSQGVRIGTRGGCDWSSPGSMLDNRVLTSLVPHPSQAGVYFTTTSDNSMANGVFRTSDGGTTWQAVGTTLGEAFLNGLAVAVDGQHFYLSGVVAERTDGGMQIRHKIWASTDGGTSWSSTHIEVGPDDEKVKVLGVAPDDAERVFAVVQDKEDMVDRKDRLLVSNDGGASFELVREAFLIRGFATNAETGEFWIGTRSGLLHFDSGAGTPTPVGPEIQVGCLHHEAGKLWACGEGLGESFALGVSNDGGQSFDHVTAFRDVEGQVTCSGQPQVKNACTGSWNDWYREIIEPSEADAGASDGGAGNGAGDAGSTDAGVVGSDPVDAGSGPGPTPDGSMSGSPDSGSGGCNCHTIGEPMRGVPLAIAFMFGLVAFRRRRRRRGT